jgi:aminopeptidase
MIPGMSTLEMMAMSFGDELSKLAEVCLKAGVNLQWGQELIITAPIEARRMVHDLTRISYQLGAKLVSCLYEDPDTIRSRLEYSEPEFIDYAATWRSRGVAEALENGAARLNIVGPYPDLLADIAPDKIVRVHASSSKAAEREAKFTSDSRINWSTVPFVTDSWARTVFPDLPIEEASRRLWALVFDVTRVTSGDRVQEWRGHNLSLTARRDMLQRRNFSALQFHDGQTDLTIGLADAHRWVGGTIVAANGVECVCNMPNEEVFTCPHKDRTNGRMFLSRPLILAGTPVEDLNIEFRDGVVVSVAAAKGQAIFEQLISSDDGARRLGEIGLVPHSSRVSRSGTLFYNALFDKNAASHVAFGQSNTVCLADSVGSAKLPPETGANHSSIHIDCMLGNSEMDVDGILASGAIEPIMRGGEFVI